MICVWWDWEGMVYWEMLERNDTVTKELYIAQLHRVKEAMRLKRPPTRPNHAPSRQRQASCCTSRESRTRRARMGGPSASAVFSGPCTDGLQSFPLPNHYLRQ
ncbi:hypothetical protein RB195_012957 [Necator americanus]|uniref:Uncharacterized protein n=1 Tax=Necator americanus TaxID=51031 RepID=A0ABR1DTA9_NECAM